MIPFYNTSSQLKHTYLGPDQPSNLSRKYLSYSSNQAPAYVPDALITPLYFSNLPAQAKVEDCVIKPAVTTELLDSLSDDIENHVEARIQSFLYQMILTYKTGIQFILYTHAEMQVGEVNSRANSIGEYAAAHSGTLTTLRIPNGRSDNTSTAFGKGSSFYNAWNITVYLPTLVNQVDMKLDSSTRYCCDGRNLRRRATEILNRVSAGNSTPQDGLRAFLQAMIEILDQVTSLERNQQNLKILRCYSTIAESYYENTNNGYPLLQKLFFRPITDTINDLFYLTVQAPIHSQFKAEMALLMPRQEVPSTLANNFNIEQIKAGVIIRLSTLLSLNPKSPKKKESVTEEYIKCCTLSHTIEQLAINYFNHLSSLPFAEQGFDLTKLTEVKTNKNIKIIGLSAPAFSLHQAVVTEIQKDPQKMPLILFSILDYFLRKIELLRIKELPPLSIKAREDLSTLINRRIVEANIEITPTTTEYATKCAKDDKVKTLAFTFFHELIIRNDGEVIAAEIDKILSIKTEKTLPKNLPQSIIDLNQEALAVIRSTAPKDPKNKKLTPKKMGFILCRTLINILRPSILQLNNGCN